LFCRSTFVSSSARAILSSTSDCALATALETSDNAIAISAHSAILDRSIGLPDLNRSGRTAKAHTSLVLGSPDQVSTADQAFRIPLDGVVMQLRRTELELVAAGLGEFDSSEEGDLVTLAAALQRLPPKDRAATWELAVRRFGRHKPLTVAAGEVGIDEVHARALIDRFTRSLAEVPPPEHQASELPDR
jgi:hypothetical protein